MFKPYTHDIQRFSPKGTAGAGRGASQRVGVGRGQAAACCSHLYSCPPSFQVENTALLEGKQAGPAPGSHCCRLVGGPRPGSPILAPAPGPSSRRSCPGPGLMLHAADFRVAEAPVVPSGWGCVCTCPHGWAPCFLPKPSWGLSPHFSLQTVEVQIPKPSLPTLGRSIGGQRGGGGTRAQAVMLLVLFLIKSHVI